MTGSNIDLNLFTVFDAIYQGGGITAAGRRLHLSQPAVSHALRRLRELLGDPLFERKRNAMIPTPRARALAGTVRACLESLERLAEQGACFEPTQATRRFRLALRHIHERSLLPNTDAANEWFRRQLRQSWRVMRRTPADATPKSRSAKRRSRHGSPTRPSGR